MTDPLMDRARALGLHGLVAHWDDIGETGWLTAQTRRTHDLLTTAGLSFNPQLRERPRGVGRRRFRASLTRLQRHDALAPE